MAIPLCPIYGHFVIYNEVIDVPPANHPTDTLLTLHNASWGKNYRAETCELPAHTRELSSSKKKDSHCVHYWGDRHTDSVAARLLHSAPSTLAGNCTSARLQGPLGVR